MGADFATLALGTLIAGEGLADAALAGRNGELAANTADQEVQLVGVGGADVQQLGLQLGDVAVARVLHAHRRLDWLGHQHFLTPSVVQPRGSFHHLSSFNLI